MYKDFVGAQRAFFRYLNPIRHAHKHGKITVFTLMAGMLAIAIGLGSFFEFLTPLANASNVTTSVTVLNTPPQWTINGHEVTESSTSTPTNAGDVIQWQGTGTDSNNDNYYLVICKTTASTTPSSTTTPTCGGGNQNLWAISALTASGVSATAATTTINAFPFDQENNVWTAWICDNNATGAQCNYVYTQGDPGFPLGNSPFVVNHPPIFFSVSNTGNVNPGGNETWSAVATDTDKIRGGDTIKLYVCQAAGFISTSSSPCTNGTWATSSPASSHNPNVTVSTTTTISIPKQDKLYNAFVYLVDQSNLVASAGTTSLQGSNSPFAVNNVTPTISAATVTLINPATATTTGEIILNQPHATSGPFQIRFIVTDNNSCQNASSGNEIVYATGTVYRSGVTQHSCQTAGQYNSNSCYPEAATSTDPANSFTCTQDTSGATTGDGCSGATDATVGWVCTFNLNYNADPTDANSFFSAQNWLASVQAVDDNASSSAETESAVGTQVDSLLAFNVSTTSIAYGGLQPSQETDPFVQTTDLNEWGNTGLDEALYGDPMCTDWSTNDRCYTGTHNNTNTIPVASQQFATSSVNYGTGQPTPTYPLTATTSPFELHLHVPKTTATSTPQNKNTFWGINIPSAITLSGSYTGQNTITAVEASSTFW